VMVTGRAREKEMAMGMGMGMRMGMERGTGKAKERGRATGMEKLRLASSAPAAELPQREETRGVASPGSGAASSEGRNVSRP
jgi:hypothetical protein